jgi:hypothetical protein
MLGRTVPLQFGQATLVPKLHREADDEPSSLLQERCDGRRIDAAGHGDSDEAGPGLRALGKRVELGCSRHNLGRAGYAMPLHFTLSSPLPDRWGKVGGAGRRQREQRARRNRYRIVWCGDQG